MSTAPVCLCCRSFYDGAMTAPRYAGPFVGVIGEEDLLKPTPARLGWLVLGLAGALVVGFALGLIIPRRRERRRQVGVR